MRLKAATNFIVICMSILFCISDVCAGENIPRNWRIPADSEIQDKYDQWRNRDKNKFLLVEGDFNGDGVRDKARLLISQKDPPRLGLFAFVSQKDDTFKTFLLLETDDLRTLGIE